MPHVARYMGRGFVGLDAEDFGIAVHRETRVRHTVQLAEAPAETFLLFDRHLLIAKKNHLVFQEGRADFVELVVADVSAEIDPEYFRTDRGRQLAYLDGPIGHDGFPLRAAGVEIDTQPGPQPRPGALTYLI